MRVLETATGQFRWINDPRTSRYAILSHTWADEGEQTYQDILVLQAKARKRHAILRRGGARSRLATFPKVQSHTDESEVATSLSILSDPLLSPKIKGVCDFARQHGYDLVWADSCCIDKSSSAELSEAINSMYEWYRLADVCYAYLADVPENDKPDASDSAFRRSRWHKRCWTLQELVAPEHVLFVANEWSSIGTKRALVKSLEDITGITPEILTLQAPLDSASVADRMQWAAKRDATRVEDEAYSLMGIFGVHMTTIYGEGRNAFARLQEEILKRIPDQTLFAWGPGYLACPDTGDPEGVVDRVFGRRSKMPISIAEWQAPQVHGLLATSPKAFRDAGRVLPITTEEFASRLSHIASAPVGLQSSDYVIGAHGVRFRAFLLDLTRIPPESSSIWQRYTAAYDFALKTISRCGCQGSGCTTLALLQCRDVEGRLIALPLCPSPPEEAMRGLVVGTRSEFCALCDCMYRRIVTFPQASFDILSPHLSTPPQYLSVRRDPLPPAGFKIPTAARALGEPTYRVRRITLEPWCLALLHKHGYTCDVVPSRSGDEWLLFFGKSRAIHGQSQDKPALQNICIHLCTGKTERPYTPRSNTLRLSVLSPRVLAPDRLDHAVRVCTLRQDSTFTDSFELKHVSGLLQTLWLSLRHVEVRDTLSLSRHHPGRKEGTPIRSMAPIVTVHALLAIELSEPRSA